MKWAVQTRLGPHRAPPVIQAGPLRMHQVPAEKAVGRSRLQPGKQSAAIHGWCRGAVRLRGLAARLARLAGRAKTAAQSQQRTRRHGRQREVRVPAATHHRSGGCAEGPEQRTRHVAATQEWYPPAKPKTLRAHAAPRCADQDLHGRRASCARATTGPGKPCAASANRIVSRH